MTLLGACSNFDSSTLGQADQNSNPPPAVQCLGLTEVCGEDITLYWDPSQPIAPSVPLNLTGYKLYYGSIAGTYSTVIDLIAPSAVSTDLSSLPEGRYYFAIKAYNSYGESPFSNELPICMRTCVSSRTGKKMSRRLAIQPTEAEGTTLEIKFTSH